nr:hypothetical protein [Micromonospora provocatoris]
MASGIRIDDANFIMLELPRRPLRFSPGVGGAQVDLTLRVSRSQDAQVPTPLLISGSLFTSGRNPSGTHRVLCQLQAEHPMSPTVRSSELRLTGFATDHQMRILEELRQGADLWMIFRPSATSVEGEPVAMVTRLGNDLRFDLGGGEWGQLLQDVDRGGFIEVVVPISGGTEDETAVRRLTTARGLLGEGKIEEALGEARKALEVARAWYGTAKTVREWEKKAKEAREQGASPDPRKRTLDERWAFQVEDLFSLLSGAAHDDDVTKEFAYTRADGVALVASTAGVLGRLAADRQRL